MCDSEQTHAHGWGERLPFHNAERSAWEADLCAASKSLMGDRVSLAAPTLCSYGAHYGWELAVTPCLSLPIALCAWIIGVCHRTELTHFNSL